MNLKNNYFLINNILFHKKNEDKNKNIFQYFDSRTGVSNKISKKICAFTGLSINDKIKNVHLNVNTKKLKYIFNSKYQLLDIYVKRDSAKQIKKYLDVYNYKASRYINRLPLNGQRRRANGNTCKKIRPFFIKD